VWSPVGLLALMTGALANVRVAARAVGVTPVCTTLYLDDRSYVSRSAGDALVVRDIWAREAISLGLQENLGKSKLVVKGIARRRAAEAAGAGPLMADSVRVLGVDLVTRAAGVLRNTAEARFTEARRRAAKIAVAPFPWKLKHTLLRWLVVSKACWGVWMFDLGPRMIGTTLPRLIRKALGENRACRASPDLRALLCGHALSMWYAAGHQAATMLALAVRAGGQTWARSPCPGSWQARVRKRFRSLDWQEIGPWRWRRAAQQVTMDWNLPAPGGEPHLLREAWRRARYNDWLSSGRRDAGLCAGVPYSENACRWARAAYEAGSYNQRTVLAGGAMSTAYAAVIFSRQMPAVCSRCSQEVVPGWYHLARQCPAFASGRPSEPSNPIALRAGWPQSRGESRVLSHLARVRYTLLRDAGYCGGATL
jgi:hypothetical protein